MTKQHKVRANIRILPVKGVSQTINYLLEDRDELWASPPDDFEDVL